MRLFAFERGETKSIITVNEEVIKIFSALDDPVGKPCDVDTGRGQLLQLCLGWGHQWPENRPVFAVPGKERKGPDGLQELVQLGAVHNHPLLQNHGLEDQNGFHPERGKNGWARGEKKKGIEE